LKNPDKADWRRERKTAAEAGPSEVLDKAEPSDREAIERSIHLPRPTAWPLVTALGLCLVFGGPLFNPYLAAPGSLMTFAGLIGWTAVMERVEEV
jgi:hypothetical protein